MGRKKAIKAQDQRRPVVVRLKHWCRQQWFTCTMIVGIVATMLVIRSIPDLRIWWDANPDRQLAEFVMAHDGTLLAAGSEKRINNYAGVPFGRFDISEISLRGASLDTDAIQRLARRRDIEVLDVSGNPLTDAAINTLASLQSLHKLDLTRTHLTASGAARLRRTLPACQITAPADDNFCQWALETGTAKSLVVEVDLSSRGTRGRRRCATLEELPEQALTVIEADFRGATAFDDKGTLHLQGLGAVEVLLLDGTAITDDSIEVLGTLASLKRLSVRGIKITEASVTRLKEKLPNVDLRR